MWSCARFGLGTAFVAVSGLVAMFWQTRNGSGDSVDNRDSGYSAYSVFNRGAQRLPGDRDRAPDLH